MHVRKNEPWFVAAVGGPSCKRCGLQDVCVLDLLQDKLSDKFDKEGGDDADSGRGENGENEDGATDDLPGDIDPMLLLDADVHDEPNLETPQKRKRVYKGTECAYPPKKPR